MDKKIDRIEDKLDKVSDKIASIDVTLAAQHESLKEHMRRTLLLEEQLEPVKKHVSMVNGALKLILGFSVVLGIIEMVLRITRN